MNVSSNKVYIGELYSAISHSVGALLGIAGLVLMIIRVDNNLSIIASIIYGVGIILLYSSSSIYHFFPSGRVKKFFRKLDHMSIYIFIAATYTPLCICALPKSIGISILSIIWFCALFGVISNISSTHKNRVLASIIYVLMGWIIIFAFKPLISIFSINILIWLLGGGIFYTIGAFLYAFGKKYNKRTEQFTHDIFHIFVLIGSFCHFWFIYNYVV